MGKPTKLEVDLIVGADGANSRVAKEIGAGEYDYAIAFQVRLAWTFCAGACSSGKPFAQPCCVQGHLVVLSCAQSKPT